MTAPLPLPPSVHANCVVIGEAGVLVRGASGAGKSSFSLALIDRAAANGRFARLVADDRVRLFATNGRLLAFTPTEIAGLIERRGLGVQRTPYIASAVVRLVVDIEPLVARMPDGDHFVSAIEGLTLPRISIPLGAVDGPALTMAALAAATPQARDCVSSALAFSRQVGKISDAMTAPTQSRSDGAQAARGGRRLERNEFCAETR